MATHRRLLPPRLAPVLVGAAGLCLTVALLGACQTTTAASTRATQGVVVSAPLEEAWSAVRATLPRAASAGVPMSALAQVRGTTVEVRLQRHASGGTILDVTSDDPAVAEEVQLAIQRALLTR